MSIISFAIVLGVGFYKHGLKFLTLFLPHGTPKPLLPIIFVVELISFLVRPFSLGLRPFIAMFAGHILLEVFGSFVVQGLNTGTALGYGVTALAFLFVVFVNALELLVGAIQAFVFALLTALYINDAVNLH
jgi:F-type H+-transporting ATPase subunit a